MAEGCEFSNLKVPSFMDRHLFVNKAKIDPVFSPMIAHRSADVDLGIRKFSLEGISSTFSTGTIVPVGVELLVSTRLNFHIMDEISLFTVTGVRKWNGFCLSWGAISSHKWPNVTSGWNWHWVSIKNHWIVFTNQWRWRMSFSKCAKLHCRLENHTKIRRKKHLLPLSFKNLRRQY